MSSALQRAWYWGVLFAALLIVPRLAMALGFGPLQLQSSLGEPFEARIPLVSISPQARDSLTVHMGDRQLYQQHGLHRGNAISMIDVDVVEPQPGNHQVVLELTSTQPIRAPLLQLVVVAETGHGRRIRQYTVFLNPPGWSNDNGTAPVRAGVGHNGADSRSRGGDMTSQSYATVNSASVTAGDADGSSAADKTTPQTRTRRSVLVEAGESLWGVATALHYDQVSIYKVAAAVFHMNPHAFNGSIGQLMAGSTLVMPTLARVKQVNLSSAKALVNQAQQKRLDQLVAKTNVQQYLSPNYFAGQTNKTQQNDTAQGQLRLEPAGAAGPAGQRTGREVTDRAFRRDIIKGSGFGTLTIPEQYTVSAGKLELLPAGYSGPDESGNSAAKGGGFGRLSAAPSRLWGDKSADAGQAIGRTAAQRTPSTSNAELMEAKSQPGSSATDNKMLSAGQSSTTDNHKQPVHKAHSPAGAKGYSPDTAGSVDDAPQPHNWNPATTLRQTWKTIQGILTVHVVLWIVVILALLIAGGLWLQPRLKQRKAGTFGGGEQANV